MIKIEITKSVLEWLCIEFFPNSKAMAASRANIYPKNDVEYMVNEIVAHVFEQIARKFELKKLNTTSRKIKIKLPPAEALTLFRFLKHYPALKNNNEFEQVWKRVQISGMLDQLARQLPLLQDLG